MTKEQPFDPTKTVEVDKTYRLPMDFGADAIVRVIAVRDIGDGQGQVADVEWVSGGRTDEEWLTRTGRKHIYKRDRMMTTRAWTLVPV